MTDRVRTIHYLNQFFGGLGGEEQAGAPPQWFDGPRGPGVLAQKLAPELDIVGTIVAGDNYMAEYASAALVGIKRLVESHITGGTDPAVSLILAGPAFNAGRYGMACGAVCAALSDRLGIPAVTAMHAENPAADIYRRKLDIVAAAADVMGMNEAMGAMVKAGLKLAAGEKLSPDADGILRRGIRENFFADKTGAERAIDMLMGKLSGSPPPTEYAMPSFERVPPAPAVTDLRHATLALVTSGGIVPRGNPDRIESANASKFGAYSLEGVEALSADTHQTVHGGYDPSYANDDPNRVLPVDVVRDLEREGRIGRLSPTYYATVGNATSVERAEKFGAEIAGLLINEGVQAAILTST